MATRVDRIMAALGLSSQPSKAAEISLSLTQHLGATPSQKANALNRAVTNSQGSGSNGNQNISPESIISCLDPILRRISTSKRMAAELELLAPEINQAANIMIPSIMSPNDLQEDSVGFVITGDIGKKVQGETQQEIIEYLEENFLDGHFNLTNLIPKWLRTALYGEGAQPIITIPESELDYLINSPDSYTGNSVNASVSKTVAIEQLLNENDVISKLGELSKEIGSEALSKTTKQTGRLTKQPVSPPRYSLESIASLIPEITTDEKIRNNAYTAVNKKHTDISLAMEEIEREVMDLSGGRLFDDNPDILKKFKSSKKTLKEISDSIITKLSKPRQYKDRKFIDTSEHANERPNEDTIGPLVLMPPMESLMPLFTPGSPTDHLGYFLMTDPNDGNPVIFKDEEDDITLTGAASHSNKSSLYDNLYRAMGVNELTGIAGTNAVTNRVYNMVVDEHIKRVLKGVGLDKLKLGNMNNIYKCMFSRYLKNAGTRLLFIPKDLCTYFTFEYHDDGTGKSRLESVQWPLTMRTTLLVCGIMAAIRDSADRKTVNIGLHAGEANPLGKINIVKSELTKKMGYDFSITNPDTIRDTLYTDAFSIKATNVPGYENFEITRDSTPSQTVPPNLDIMEQVVNMTIHGLLVPPAALNQTSENEYAKSVVTTNLFFQNTVCHLQDKTCEQVSETVRTQLTHTWRFRELAKKVLTDAGAITAVKDGDIDDDMIQAAIDDLIANISIVLPRPNIAPTVAQHEEFVKVIEIVNASVAALFPDSLAEQSNSDTNIATGIAKAKEQMTRTAIAQYASNCGSPFLKSIITELGTTDTLTKLANLGKKISLEVEACAKLPGANSEDEMSADADLTVDEPTDSLIDDPYSSM